MSGPHTLDALIAKNGLTLGADTRAPTPDIDLTWVPTDRIVVDPRYQRLISTRGRSKIKKICATFDWQRFGALVLAQMPDGAFAVIDGQHRAIAAQLLGAPNVPACVIRADIRDQASAFSGINTERTSVASIDKFRARVTAEDPAASDVAHILAELGISYDVPAGYQLKPRQTRAVSGIEKIVKRLGKGIAFSTLEMLIDAQPDENNLLSNFAVQVTATTLARVIDNKGDIERLQTLLEETDFESLKENAAHLTKIQGGQQIQRGCELLLQAYNKRLQKKVA